MEAMAHAARRGYGPMDYANEYVAFARLYVPPETLMSPLGVFARAEVGIQLTLRHEKNSRPETFNTVEKYEFATDCAPALSPTFAAILNDYLEVANRPSTAEHLSKLRVTAGESMDRYVEWAGRALASNGERSEGQRLELVAATH
jgi:hypothetical protein